ncbi:hypothetical protein PV326_013621 [Microctonus aethiopoides]|nr:hypothetical protein PV326_013621 [Microctonus aethiopoides]
MTLNAETLTSDVLDIRLVNAKNKTVQNDVDNRRIKLSYIVKFKSVYASRHEIDLKKRKKELTANQVFNCLLASKIYVNEFLSPRMHSLYNKVKELAKTDHDLELLESSGLDSNCAIKKVSSPPVVYANITVCQLNANSLLGHLNQIRLYAVEHNCDIITINDIWLRPKTPIKQIQMWHSLPSHITTATSLPMFKHPLFTYLLKKEFEYDVE